MNQTCDPAAVRFGPFLYEPINGRLLRAGAELGVPPRALAILGCLVQRPGLLASKQDLLDHV
jgi:DNA-binding winged helix-turn-helix (wHTH) protein